MYTYVANFIACCEICSKCKTENHPPKAPLLPIHEPEAPMEFISLDIGYMPQDVDGYILLIGDLFSKYIEVIPLVDQTAPTIIEALHEHWLSRHGYPQFLLTDQGSNVDGSIVNKLCEQFNITKRRTSGYHSQGNGFAERNIRSVKETFRTLLLEFKLPQMMWRGLLPSVVFALNTSVSASTKCTPYQVIYARNPSFPVDILMDTVSSNPTATTQLNYLKDMKIQIRDIILHVSKNLLISRHDMMRQYNKNIKYFNYLPGEGVWVKRRNFKPGESRKLAPRKSGPWTIVEKKSNGVNFEIVNSKGESKIIHHDRLVPINQYQHKKKTNFPKTQNITDTPQNKETEPAPNFIYSSEDSSDDECVPGESGSETEREETIEAISTTTQKAP